MGDEVRRTQGGNNNAYGHDDATSWFDWTGVDRHADLLRFTKGLIALRRRARDRRSTCRPTPACSTCCARRSLEWSGVRVGSPDLGPDSHSVALTLRADEGALHLIFNAWWEPLDFELPSAGRDGDGLAADHRHEPRLARRHRRSTSPTRWSSRRAELHASGRAPSSCSPPAERPTCRPRGRT